VTHPVEELTALLDGALPGARRTEVEAHLAGCPACRAERNRLAGATALLAALPAPPVPSPRFATRLAARLAREPAPAAAAAVALLTVRHQRAEELALAGQLDLLEEYEVVASLGDVETEEDAAVVASLDQPGPKGTP